MPKVIVPKPPGMLDFFISKYYLLSANTIYHQQILFIVSKYYLASAKFRQRQQILFIVSKGWIALRRPIESAIELANSLVD